jgi:hypothetical protein
MGGVISGSSVLKSVLQEDWNSTDIDVYVTEENLRSFLTRNTWRFDNYARTGIFRDPISYLAEYVSRSDTNIIHDHLKDLLHKSNSGETPYLLSLYNALKATGNTDKDIEVEILKTVRNEMKTTVVKLLGGKDSELIPKENAVKNYHELSGIVYVIRFTFCDKKVDLVVCRCTVPFVIDNFDFGFNKVYYDGYSINCLDWEAVSTKIATNDYCRDLNTYNEIERYVYNISRIRKYFNRGYLVLL